MRTPARRTAPPTRVLLACAALAGIHTLIHLAVLPLLSVLAPASPPLYALVASAHSLMPFLARRLTGRRGTATLTSAIAAVFVATTSSLGVLALVPLLLTGAVIDGVLWRRDEAARWPEGRYLVAGAAVAVALWAVSLSVFSPEHLTPAILLGTALARVLGELAIVACSRVLAVALGRAGVGRTLRHTPRHGQASARRDGSAEREDQLNGSGAIGSS